MEWSHTEKKGIQKQPPAGVERGDGRKPRRYYLQYACSCYVGVVTQHEHLLLQLDDGRCSLFRKRSAKNYARVVVAGIGSPLSFQRRSPAFTSPERNPRKSIKITAAATRLFPEFTERWWPNFFCRWFVERERFYTRSYYVFGLMQSQKAFPFVIKNMISW